MVAVVLHEDSFSHKIEAHSELITKNRGSIGYGFYLRRGEEKTT